MRAELIRHPASAGPDIAIAVDVERRGGTLRLRYEVDGPLDALVLPPPAEPRRADNLWRHSCFEAFVGTGTGYVELNAAPSRAWAAYRFDGYRDGMREAELAPPLIEVSKTRRFVLTLTFALPPDASGPLGLSAVIEAKDGTLSYWALAHPPGAPDFHHPACFALELPAPH